MSKPPAARTPAPRAPRPTFTTIAEEAAVIVEGAITWSTATKGVEPNPAELRRMAEIHRRWSAVYDASEQLLLRRAAELETASAAPVEKPGKGPASKLEKPRKPDAQKPRLAFKVRKIETPRGTVLRATATAPAPAARLVPTPPPLRRAVVD